MGIEMIFIFLLALILFGPKRLPEMAREIGKFVAEFKRASNDFKYQLQAEIEKAGTDTPSAQQPAALPSAPQQTTSFTQTILPPSVKSAISGIDEAHERLMKTARMAFDAQNFTLRPPEPPPVAAIEPELPSTPPATPSPAQSTEPAAPTGAPDAFHASSGPAPAGSNSAPQRS
jgi:sec-independent protein translocase protein TatB